MHVVLSRDEAFFLMNIYICIYTYIYVLSGVQLEDRQGSCVVCGVACVIARIVDHVCVCLCVCVCVETREYEEERITHVCMTQTVHMGITYNTCTPGLTPANPFHRTQLTHTHTHARTHSVRCVYSGSCRTSTHMYTHSRATTTQQQD